MKIITLTNSSSGQEVIYFIIIACYVQTETGDLEATLGFSPNKEEKEKSLTQRNCNIIKTGHSPADCLWTYR